jgi:hypothetical protein
MYHFKVMESFPDLVEIIRSEALQSICGKTNKNTFSGSNVLPKINHEALKI